MDYTGQFHMNCGIYSMVKGLNRTWIYDSESYHNLNTIRRQEADLCTRAIDIVVLGNNRSYVYFSFVEKCNKYKPPIFIFCILLSFALELCCCFYVLVLLQNVKRRVDIWPYLSFKLIGT